MPKRPRLTDEERKNAKIDERLETIDPSDVVFRWFIERRRGRPADHSALSLGDLLAGMAVENDRGELGRRRVMRLAQDYYDRGDESVIARVLSGRLSLSVFDEKLDEPLAIERDFPIDEENS